MHLLFILIIEKQTEIFHNLPLFSIVSSETPERSLSLIIGFVPSSSWEVLFSSSSSANVSGVSTLLCESGVVVIGNSLSYLRRRSSRPNRSRMTGCAFACRVDTDSVLTCGV